MHAVQLQRIHAYLRVAAPRGRDAERIGPFLATFNRDSDNPYLNYAIPDDGSTPSDDDVDSLSATLANGGLVVLARDAATGEPAGGGLCTGPHEGATELTSIGVREPFRRRGIAEAMTRVLAREMHTRGNDGVFLMADGPPEERIYARAGFTTISDILHISAG